ncbi:uncharacterized protein C8Q71DRAFT_860308 [Rhodofomes roseus]|uniref:BTB domain-containing protein n=1 Tax=Rhodofomes roseus TaxID=34475 RepID=A0ABQ8K890_9APHY|nr:uncharacterized protein C8Q71DRAFT_860308 [Rhodofomes roseus]KAH9833512.1 hypothetical protein C8Q71DRAFT_860308 [Rhodofomes roseus]
MVPQRHERYYFDDGNVIFLVEDTLYNVHRYFLKRDSPVFQTMFSQPSGTSGEGESDDNPITLEGIKSADFANFLSCIYPSNLGQGDLTTYEEWSAALELAVRWEFNSVRDFIVRRMKDTGTLAEQVAMARRLDMQQWCWDACTKLCQRAKPLTLEEGQRLGVEDTVRISQVRENLRVHPRVGKNGDLQGYRVEWGSPMELEYDFNSKRHDNDTLFEVKQTLCLPELPYVYRCFVTFDFSSH